MSHADKQFEVATYGETLFIAAIFIFVLIVLYPKAMLQEQILAESKNYDLTTAYLRNMIKLEPQNDELLVRLTKLSIERGKLDLGGELLSVLRQSNVPALIEQRRLLEYRLLKAERALHVAIEEQNKIDDTLRALMAQAAAEGVKDIDLAKVWFEEAMKLEEPHHALAFLSVLTRSNEPYWLEQCLYLAGSLGAYDQQFECVEALLRHDGAHHRQWLLARYHVALASERKDRAIESALELALDEPRYYNEAAMLYAALGDYEAAADLMLARYRESGDVRILLRALDWLRSGGLKRRLVEVMHAYEERYLDDPKVSNAFMRIYLASEQLEEARRLASKVLRRQP